jgi:hypothetical protein
MGETFKTTITMKTSSASFKAPLQLLLALACVLLGGCASPDFTPYVGEQDWPQGTGCNVETNYIVPIYYGWPDKPYTVLGVITISGIHSAAVARYAKSKGADALIYRTSLTGDAGSYTTPGYATSYTSDSGFTTTTYSPGTTIPLTVTVSVYNAIKWQNPLTVAADKLDNTLVWTNLTPAQVAECVNGMEAVAEKGNVEAQYFLGTMYANGVRVKLDYVEALPQTNTAARLSNGLVIKQDYVEAVKWYGKAAEQGNIDAQLALGNCYGLGEGVPQDYAEAVKWYRRGAMQGDADAQLDLGDCYMAGSGVPKDYIEAYKWFNLASAQGNAVAKDGLSAIENVMTPDQIAEAQSRAAAFIPQSETPNTSTPSTPSPQTNTLKP